MAIQSIARNMLPNLYAHGKNYCSHIKNFLIAAATLLIVLLAVYLQFNSTFIIDEIYDGNGLRELGIHDKLTIRLDAPSDSRILKKFVEHYSLCPCVHDILVVSRPGTKISPDMNFQYQKTHSTVTFMGEESESTNYLIKTDSLFLVDPSIFVSCEDLKFTLNVWKSSQDSLVGYLPRLHSKSRSASGSVQLSFLNWWYVWWHGRYSLMLPSAVILKKSLWESYLGVSEEAKGVKEILEMHPECEDMALPLWAAFQQATSPVYVDVPLLVDDYAVKKSNRKSARESDTSGMFSWLGISSKEGDMKQGGLSVSYASSMTNSECLTTVHRALKKPLLGYSTHKASNSKTLWCW